MRLSATDLACRRGGRDVFAGVSFSVASGESLTIRGRNGAGKSSLLRMMAGLVRVAGGQLSLEGGDPELTLGEQAHYLGHLDALKPSLSVEENLRFWSAFLGAAARRSQTNHCAPSGSIPFPSCRQPICPPANGGGFRSRACSRSSARYGFSTSRPRHLMPRRKCGWARSCRCTWPAAASSSRRRTARCNSTARGS